MKFLCVKRQSLNGFVCPKDVFKPNRIYSANAIGVIDTKNHLIKLQNDMRKDYLRDGLFYDKYLAATAQ